MRWKSKKRHMDNYREGAYKIAIWLLPILGVLDDIYAHSTGMHGIVVQEDYLTTIFSATIAVVTLGNTVEALIIGSFNDRIWGLSVKEVVQLPTCKTKVDMAHTIQSTALMAFVALIAFSLKLYALITMTFVITLLIIATTSKHIWNLLSNDQVVKETILAAINSSDNDTVPSFFNLSFVLNRLFAELSAAIISGDDSTQDKYIKLIQEITNAARKGSLHEQLIHQKTEKLFGDACVASGFVDASIVSYALIRQSKIEKLMLIRLR